mgnify:CR=1 FL=1
MPIHAPAAHHARVIEMKDAHALQPYGRPQLREHLGESHVGRQIVPGRKRMRRIHTHTDGKPL